MDERLRKAGVPVEPRGEGLFVRDPSGNGIRFEAADAKIGSEDLIPGSLPLVLDGKAADDASCAQHQHGFAGSEPGAPGKRQPCGQTGITQCSGDGVIGAIWDLDTGMLLDQGCIWPSSRTAQAARQTRRRSAARG